MDLIVTSPPYFGLRDYRDDGGSLAGQIGAERTPREYIDALLDVTRECLRVLKPTGSLWVNLGDKYNERSGPGHPHRGDGEVQSRPPRPPRVQHPGRPKSQLLLPERYRIGCVDELGLIARATIVWAKQNGLPESVTDRVRCSHEYVYHFTKSARYYSAVDEIRESHAEPDGRPAYGRERPPAPGGNRGTHVGRMPHAAHRDMGQNVLGKLPGSVWTIPAQPLNVPDHVAHARCCDGRKRPGCEDGLDHYAAFPFALVRPIILGWSPQEVCTACGEGRRPVTERTADGREQIKRAAWAEGVTKVVTGYACSCPDTTAPATPGIVLDPCGGTGSTALVAGMAGRIGVSNDASWDYTGGIARWRVNDPHERARAAGLDPERVAAIPRLAPGQASLFDGATS